MENNRFNNNIRVLVEEAHAQTHSGRWQEADQEARAIHPSLSAVITQAARNLPGVAQDIKETAFRIGDAAIREVAASGKDDLNEVEQTILARRVFRSVLVQEGANQILHEKGSPTVSDFMGLKQAYHDPSRSLGLESLTTLKANAGFDLRAVAKTIEINELRSVAIGAYDRVKPETLAKIAPVLEVSTAELGDRYPMVSIGREPVRRPYMEHPRTSFRSHAPQRSFAFGRKIGVAEHLAQTAQQMTREARAM